MQIGHYSPSGHDLLLKLGLWWLLLQYLNLSSGSSSGNRVATGNPREPEETCSPGSSAIFQLSNLREKILALSDSPRSPKKGQFSIIIYFFKYETNIRISTHYLVIQIQIQAVWYVICGTGCLTLICAIVDGSEG